MPENQFRHNKIKPAKSYNWSYGSVDQNFAHLDIWDYTLTFYSTLLHLISMSLFYEPYRRNIKKDRTLSKISNFRSFRNSKYSELLPILTKIERCLLLGYPKSNIFGNPGQQDGFAPTGRSQNEVKNCQFCSLWFSIYLETHRWFLGL